MPASPAPIIKHVVVVHLQRRLQWKTGWNIPEGGVAGKGQGAKTPYSVVPVKVGDLGVRLRASGGGRWSLCGWRAGG